MYLRLLTVTLALLLLLPGCARQDSLQHIQSSGKLTVVTRNSPTTYYQDKEGASPAARGRTACSTFSPAAS
jgi:membrane-bound lytic murein transglycosylase F